MFEWLKTILGDAYTDEIDTEVAKAIGKDFVSRSDFNSRGEQLKNATATISERDKQLEDLKKVDAAGLQSKIEELQEANKTQAAAFEKQIEQLKMSNAIETALTTAKAKNITAVKALLNLDEIKIDKEGKITGLAEQVQKLSNDEETSFLFGKVETKGVSGFVPGEGSDKGAGNTVPKTYAEAVAYLAANPGASL